MSGDRRDQATKVTLLLYPGAPTLPRSLILPILSLDITLPDGASSESLPLPARLSPGQYSAGEECTYPNNVGYLFWPETPVTVTAGS